MKTKDHQDDMENTDLDGADDDTAEPDRPTEKDPELSQSERRLAKLEKILSNITTGYQVHISRVQPGWCKGHLETIMVEDEDEPIGLDYLANTWGGEVLRLRVKDQNSLYCGSCDVPMLSFPPKRWGKELKSPTEIEQNQSAQIAPNTTLGNLETLIGIVDKLKGQTGKTDTSAMLAMMRFMMLQQQQQQQQQQPLNAGLTQLIEAAQVLKQLKGLFGADSDAAAVQPSESPDMFGQVNALLNTYLKIKEVKEAPKLSAPQGAAIKRNPQIGAPTGGTPPAAALGIMDALKTMSPKEIADNFLMAVGQMPEDKRTAIFETMFDLLGINQGGSAGDDYGDDDEDGEDGEDDLEPSDGDDEK